MDGDHAGDIAAMGKTTALIINKTANVNLFDTRLERGELFGQTIGNRFRGCDESVRLTQGLLKTRPAQRALVACNDIWDLELFAEPTRQMNLARRKCMQNRRLKTQQTVNQNFLVLTPKDRQPKRRMFNPFYRGTENRLRIHAGRTHQGRCVGSSGESDKNPPDVSGV
jgi:hypothetical protein